MKKIPLGVKIIGVVEITLGLLFIISFLGNLLNRSYVAALFALFLSIAFIFLGKGILELRNIIRIRLIVVIKILIALTFLMVIILGLGIFQGNFFDRFLPVILILLFACFIFIPPIFYLNCSKVKEQFK